MTNYEYIKTLSQDELVTFIMNDMTIAANDILDEIIFRSETDFYKYRP